MNEFDYNLDSIVPSSSYSTNYVRLWKLCWDACCHCLMGVISPCFNHVCGYAQVTQPPMLSLDSYRRLTRMLTLALRWYGCATRIRGDPVRSCIGIYQSRFTFVVCACCASPLLSSPSQTQIHPVLLFCYRWSWLAPSRSREIFQGR